MKAALDTHVRHLPKEDTHCDRNKLADIRHRWLHQEVACKDDMLVDNNLPEACAGQTWIGHADSPRPLPDKDLAVRSKRDRRIEMVEDSVAHSLDMRKKE